MARWIRLTGRIEDDRGERHSPHRVDVKDRISFRLVSGSLSLVEQEQQANPDQRAVILGRHVLQAGADSRVERVLVRLLAAVAFTLIGAASVVAAIRARSIWAVVVFLGCVGVVALDLSLGRRRLARQREELRLLPSVCLACGYPLTGVPPEPDGCTVCPECGAAWKLDAQSPNNAPGEGT